MAAINNPTNSFNIEKSKDEIFDAVRQITIAEKYKYSIANEDELLNRIRIREVATIGNNGYNVEFTLTRLSDSEYKVNIECSRERGGLNTDVEVNNANYILKEVTDKFSSFLSRKVNEKGQAVIPNKGTGCVVLFSIMVIIAVGIFAALL